MQQALEALEDVPYMSNKDDYERLERVTTALRQALEKPKYRRGDRLLCLETEEYCVIHISGTDRQYVKFPDGHVGQYTNQQVADHFELLPKEVDADDTRPQARSLTDELMDCVDRLGSEADTVDPRVWQHLLVYAPKPEQEPVGYFSVNDYGRWEENEGTYGEPLYTAPPKKEQEPVAWADAIVDDLQGLFDTDGITEQDSGDALIRLSDAIAVVEDEKKRYTAPQKQEPVAWANSFDLKNFDMKVRTCPDLNHTVPLYTAPPIKREWVGLTLREIEKCIHDANDDPIVACRNVEAKLKEKNT
jgi:hypothetical protein